MGCGIGVEQHREASGIRHHPTATGPLARLIHDLMDAACRARDAGVKQPRPGTWPQRHLLSAPAKHRPLQATGFAARAQAGLEQKSVPSVCAVIRCSRFGRITCARPRPAARRRPTVTPKNHLPGVGHTGQLPPATGAAGANRTSRRRSAMRLSPLSSPKQWLKSLHSVHTGVVHRMRPSSSQSVR